MSERILLPTEAGPEEVKKYKKEINDQGFEGNAVIEIGNEEEQAILTERRKSEGKFTDLETCLKLKKEVLVQKEEIPEEAISKLQPGLMTLGGFVDQGTLSYHFVDKDQNISQIIVNPHEIGTLKDKIFTDVTQFISIIQKEFESLGFKFIQDWGTGELIKKIIKNYEIQRAQKMEEQKKANFDF